MRRSGRVKTTPVLLDIVHSYCLVKSNGKVLRAKTKTLKRAGRDIAVSENKNIISLKGITNNGIEVLRKKMKYNYTEKAVTFLTTLDSV